MSPYAAPLLLISLLLSSCSRRQAAADPSLVQEAQPFPGLAFLHVADPRAEPQLLAGWHPVEQGSWRWTEKHFAVALKAPAAGRHPKAAALELKFVLPIQLMARLQSITLAATVNGVALAPRTYTKAGDQVYTQRVPAEALASGVARVDFLLDKALPPNNTDRRELGVVVSSVGLE